MADSGITVSGLAATGGVGQIALGWSVTEASCLPYLRLDKVEIWEATANDRGTAVKVAEIFGSQYVRTGLARSTSRRYWIRARDASGNFGEWFPASATAGILGTTTSTPASANSLSEVSPDAGSVTSGNFSAIGITGSTITGSLIRTTTATARIELNSTQNALNIYNAAGQIAAQLRVISGNTVASFYGNFGPASVMSVQNDGNGPAARLSGDSINPAVLHVLNLAGGSGRDAVRAENMGSGGGAIFLGRASADGGYAAYTVRGTYGPFTGAHDAVLPLGDPVSPGEIVCSTGRVIAKSGVDDALLEVTVSTEERQRGAYGVVSTVRPFLPTGDVAALPPVRSEDPPTPVRSWLSEHYQRLTVNGCGEGLILVCGRSGDIAVGDYISTSSMRGKGQRQNDEHGMADDIQRRCTVAKATQAATFDYSDQVKLLACIYLCG
ncbi:hypothetical protein [Shinella sp. JR1-6]|uniref:hypothetical protein n=1 Tax=Shinella sp. JR1-6 TaxID=2527671 RepID=UPI00102D4B48|nr:hypothetical protein [Shinella sp. JR1-6]TAA50368.1 hypothetical protein EXZ48_33080 [Shinella sp. JR1-6]